MKPTSHLRKKIFRSVQFSRSVVSDSLRPHELQHARPLCPSPTPGVHSDLHPSSQWCHPAISSSVVPFSSCPQSLPGQSLFQWVNSSHEVAKVLEFQPQQHSFQRNPRVDLLQNGLVGSPCSPRDSQESSSVPQFKSVNTSALIWFVLRVGVAYISDIIWPMIWYKMSHCCKYFNSLFSLPFLFIIF